MISPPLTQPLDAGQAVPKGQLVEIVEERVALAVVQKGTQGVMKRLTAPGQRLRPLASANVKLPRDLFAHRGELAVA